MGIHCQKAAVSPSSAQPPLAQLSQLLFLARQGDVVALRREVDLLTQQGHFDLFVTQLQSYTNTFQIQKLIEWLEALLQNQEAHA